MSLPAIGAISNASDRVVGAPQNGANPASFANIADAAAQAATTVIGNLTMPILNDAMDEAKSDD